MSDFKDMNYCDNCGIHHFDLQAMSVEAQRAPFIGKGGKVMAVCRKIYAGCATRARVEFQNAEYQPAETRIVLVRDGAEIGSRSRFVR